MQLHVIETGFFKLDGGAMFGIVPKSIWQRYVPADENNMCTWSMRCLLIEDGDRLILVDTGIGNKQPESFFKHYYLHGDASLLGSIQKAGFSPTEVTDVILTHLHFDHVGGAVQKQGERYSLTFPNARYWSNTRHWEWATHPNAREVHSFLQENFMPIKESGHLHFIEEGQPSPFEHIDFFFADGHTEKQLIPIIHYGKQRIVYAADLIPSHAHIPVHYVMGYDVRPLLTFEEKARMLEEAVQNDYVFFFEHDARHQCARVHRTEKGIRLKETFPLEAVL